MLRLFDQFFNDPLSAPATGRDGTAVAEIAFLIGMQAGFELGIAHSSPD
jgi:hypothetical protein